MLFLLQSEMITELLMISEVIKHVLAREEAFFVVSNLDSESHFVKNLPSLFESIHRSYFIWKDFEKPFSYYQILYL